MKKIKFLHCADIHLDAPFTSMGAGNNKSSIRREDLKKTFRKIIDIAGDESVDLLLVAGDLYEHEYIRKSTISFINDRFSEIPDIRVFIVPGNHDPYVANSCYKNCKWSPNVHIFTEDQAYAVLEDIGACIYGVGFSSFYEARPLVSGLKKIGAHLINILLVHGTVGLDFGREAYNPMSVDDLDSLEMDYIALGHFHNRIEGMGKNSNIYNPGSPEPLGFDETGQHGVFIGTIIKSGYTAHITDLRFINLNSRFYENVQVDVSGCNADSKVIDRVCEALPGGDLTKGLFSITLKGYIEPGYKINPSQIQQSFESRVFFMKVRDETYADYDFDEIKKEPGLRGLFVRKALSLIDRAEDKSQKKLLMKALYYGLEALDQGRIEIVESKLNCGG